MNLSLTLIIGCLTFGLVHCGLPKIRLDEAGNFVDDKGRIVLFHGFNSVKKAPPYYSEQATNETQLHMFEKWGMNVIRLGVIWNAVMPEKNVINDTYISEIGKIIDASAKFGLYVILDMHQDVFSTRFGSYDAIPTWLIDELPKPLYWFQYPWPFPSPPSEWFMGYVTYACEHFAQQLYSNTSGVWKHWANYWRILAKAFGNKTNVLGYELINEPPPGNFYTNPARLLPGHAGKYNLLPLYDYLAQQIHEIDSEGLIFYEPVTFSVFFDQDISQMGTGFDHVPGSLTDPTAKLKSVLSYHYYCWFLQTTDPSTIMPEWKRVFCDEILMPAVFKNAEKSMAVTGGGRFLTEFGLCGPDKNNRSVNTIECNNVLKLADEYLQSWTYWDGNFLDVDGNPIETQVEAFSRVYPRATAGTPNNFRFDPATGEFYYSFTARPTSKDKEILAEIVVPTEVHYPSGKMISIEPRGIETSEQNNILYVLAPAGGIKESLNVTVIISKKTT